MFIRLELDPKANAAYVRLSCQPAVESEEMLADIVFDFDVDGGVEFLNVRPVDAASPLSRGSAAPDSPT